MARKEKRLSNLERDDPMVSIGENQVACAGCANIDPDEPTQDYCTVYEIKPDSVYFFGEPCPDRVATGAE
jgi:hypothetical protein